MDLEEVDHSEAVAEGAATVTSLIYAACSSSFAWTDRCPATERAHRQSDDDLAEIVFGGSVMANQLLMTGVSLVEETAQALLSPSHGRLGAVVTARAALENLARSWWLIEGDDTQSANRAAGLFNQTFAQQNKTLADIGITSRDVGLDAFAEVVARSPITPATPYSRDVTCRFLAAMLGGSKADYFALYASLSAYAHGDPLEFRISLNIPSNRHERAHVPRDVVWQATAGALVAAACVAGFWPIAAAHFGLPEEPDGLTAAKTALADLRRPDSA